MRLSAVSKAIKAGGNRLRILMAMAVALLLVGSALLALRHAIWSEQDLEFMNDSTLFPIEQIDYPCEVGETAIIDKLNLFLLRSRSCDVDEDCLFVRSSTRLCYYAVNRENVDRLREFDEALRHLENRCGFLYPTNCREQYNLGGLCENNECLVHDFGYPNGH